MGAWPGIMYKKATGKEAPTVHSELMESLTSWAGVATHAGADTAFAIYYIFCWKLMGFPLLMGWLCERPVSQRPVCSHCATSSAHGFFLSRDKTGVAGTSPTHQLSVS